MKILIVEDETAAYESLIEMLKEVDATIQIAGCTESVEQTFHWLQSNPEPDLILMDIHLSDGSSFLIFEHIKIETPIIFVTAYDEYAIEAFKLNSIDYLLKPIKTEELKRAFLKFSKWTRRDVAAYLNNIAHLVPNQRYQEKILIPIKDKLHPVDLREVAYFYTTNKATQIGLKNGLSLSYPKTLEQLFLSLNPKDFYRANKQYIIACDSIKEITIWFDSRLLVTLSNDVPERIYISKNRAADFKSWVISEK